MSQGQVKRPAPDQPGDIGLKTRDSTICVSLPGRLKDGLKKAGMLAAIKKAAKTHSELAHHASLLAVAMLTKCLSDPSLERIIPNTLNKGFFYYVLRLCNSKSSAKTIEVPDRVVEDKDLEWKGMLYRVREELFPHGSGLAKAEYGVNIINYLATQMVTSVSNYDSMPLHQHIATYLRAKYDVKKKGHAKWLATRIMSDTPMAYTTLPNTITKDFEEARIKGIIEEENRTYKEAFPSNGALKKLKYRFSMLKAIDMANEAKTRRERFKSFSLIPVRKTGVKFIQMDILSMKKLFKSTKPKKTADQMQTGRWNELNVDVQQFKTISDFFNDKSIPERKGWNLQPTFATDGYEV
jgi:hypothetical protein